MTRDKEATEITRIERKVRLEVLRMYVGTMLAVVGTLILMIDAFA